MVHHFTRLVMVHQFLLAQVTVTEAGTGLHLAQNRTNEQGRVLFQLEADEIVLAVEHAEFEAQALPFSRRAFCQSAQADQCGKRINLSPVTESAEKCSHSYDSG